MQFHDLRSFHSFLEERGELVRVTEEVDAALEITEITDRTTKGGGPALLFENVRGFSLPVACSQGPRHALLRAIDGDVKARVDAEWSRLGISLPGGTR